MEESLRKFCQSHELFRGGFQYKAAAQLLTGQSCIDAISKGTLQVTEEQAVVADAAYNQLSNMTMDAFVNTMKKNFVCPVSDKKVLYQSMYLEIYNKSKRKK